MALCCKCFVLLFNVLLFLSGVALAGLGIWFLIDLNAFSSVVESDPNIVYCPYGMLSVGGLLLIISCIGCVGTLRERKCCIGLYFTAVLLLFIAEVGLVVLAYLNHGNIRKLAKESMNEYNTNIAIQEAWDAIQEKHNCCGYDNSLDWVWAFGEGIYHCPNTTTTDIGSITTANPNFMEGCKGAFDMYFNILQITAMAIAGIELLTMVLSICLCRRIGTDLGSGYLVGSEK